jgi:integrase/recombinase XerD
MGYPLALAPAPVLSSARAWLAPEPVEYAVAVEEYLGQASLGPASLRVYRISLTGWAWPLVGKATPAGRLRRRAVPPVVPLALLDEPVTRRRLAAAIEDRIVMTDARTVNREIPALRRAAGWWQDQGWISADPTAGLHHLRTGSAAAPALTAGQVSSLFRLPVSLREHAFWRLLYDTAAPAEAVLALDADRLDLARDRARPRPGPGGPLGWREPASNLLRWLLAGRCYGPVFVTDRRAPARTPAADICPVTGRGRMSYRRAAEIFTTATRPLDPGGRGWTLHQLQLSGLGRLED